MKYSLKAFILGLLIFIMAIFSFSQTTFSLENQNYQVRVEKGVAASSISILSGCCRPREIRVKLSIMNIIFSQVI